MLKKKLAVLISSVLAVGAIGTTALAADYYSFGTNLLIAGDPGYITNYVLMKQDDLYGVVQVDSGLASGDTFANFEIRRFSNDNVAAARELWINGKHTFPYESGQGINGEYYYLRFYMEPQANADRMIISGSWLP